MNRLSTLVAACTLALTFSVSQAAIQVGDTAKLTYQTVDGKTIDIQKMRGKIIVVDFWATWCGPCMAEAPHMVELNKKYGDKGLQMLGVSLDSDKARMLAVSQQKGFTWPQYFDGLRFENKLFAQWGSDGIPLTVLVDPNGKVVYAGHPAGGLDQAIEQTFRTTPPHVVDPSILADAGKTLDQVEARLTANDAKGAVKLMAKVPAAARSEPDFATRQDGVLKQLDAAGETMLAEVDPLIEKADYKAAVSRLRDVSDGLKGTAASAKAKKKLVDLTSKPEVKTALVEADKADRLAQTNAKANEALAAAMKLQDDKKQEQAYSRFGAIARDYPGTEAATTAAAQVKAFEQQHPDLVQKATESAATGKAKSALSLAANYKRSGHLDLAKAKYQSVIDSFPGTSFAKTAVEELSHLSEP